MKALTSVKKPANVDIVVLRGGYKGFFELCKSNQMDYYDGEYTKENKI